MLVTTTRYEFSFDAGVALNALKFYPINNNLNRIVVPVTVRLYDVFPQLIQRFDEGLAPGRRADGGVRA